VERFDDGDAESLVLTHAQITACRAVAGHELREIHVAGEMDVRKGQPADELPEGGMITLHAPVVPGQDELGVRIEISLVKIKGLDDVLELLVGDDPPHEENGRFAVGIDVAKDGVARDIELGEVHEDGQDARRGIPGALKFQPVELRVPEGQVDLAREEADLQSALVTFPGQDLVGVQEELVGRDVVVDHDLPVRDAQEHLGNGRSDRKVEDDDVPGGTELPVFPVVVDETGEARVIKPDEDLRSVTSGPKGLLDLEHLIGDGVPVGQRGGELMDVHGLTSLPARG